MTPTGVINDIRGTGVSRGWWADAPPNPAGRRALKECEQATDAASAAENDRKTGAWLLGRVPGRHHPPPCIRTIGTGRFSLTSWFLAEAASAVVGAVDGGGCAD